MKTELQGEVTLASRVQSRHRDMINVSAVYYNLCSHYGNLNWWPASSPYEVIVGAVLTQNTAWGNVEKAIANFTYDMPLSPELVEIISTEELINIIRPAGFFNQKAMYLKAVTTWYKQYDYDVETVKRQSLPALRKELLAVKGIGEETADSILLYAFGFPTFVIDAYTRRLLTRLGYANIPKKYDDVKTIFETELPLDAELYNNYHACIVINAKEHCKSKPKCDGCPLSGVCDTFVQIKANDIKSYLAEILDDKRYKHTLAVCDTAVNLAQRHGVDTQKAFLAALLHDCARGLDTEQLINYCDEHNIQLDDYMRNDINPVHAFVGADMAKQCFGINDIDILNAISRHAIGCEEMTLLDKVILVADATEPTRKGCDVDDARLAAGISLDKALPLAMRIKSRYLEGRPMHPSSVKMLEKYMYGGRQIAN